MFRSSAMSARTIRGVRYASDSNMTLSLIFSKIEEIQKLAKQKQDMPQKLNQPKRDKNHPFASHQRNVNRNRFKAQDPKKSVENGLKFEEATEDLPRFQRKPRETRSRDQDGQEPNENRPRFQNRSRNQDGQEFRPRFQNGPRDQDGQDRSRFHNAPRENRPRTQDRPRFTNRDGPKLEKQREQKQEAVAPIISDPIEPKPKSSRSQRSKVQSSLEVGGKQLTINSYKPSLSGNTFLYGKPVTLRTGSIPSGIAAVAKKFLIDSQYPYKLPVEIINSVGKTVNDKYLLHKYWNTDVDAKQLSSCIKRMVRGDYETKVSDNLQGQGEKINHELMKVGTLNMEQKSVIFNVATGVQTPRQLLLATRKRVKAASK